MVFAQPGHVTSHAVNFNVVCVRDRDLVVSITWPTGSLGLEPESQQGGDGDGNGAAEERFIRRVAVELERGFVGCFNIFCAERNI